jgi:electron transfer flavoprotein alpha subunit
VIAVIPVRDGVPALGAGEAVTEAGSRALLIGSAVAEAVSELPAGTTEITLVEAGHYRPNAWARALAEHLRNAGTVILPASPDGRDLAPGLAVHLGRGLAAGALRVAEDHYVLPLAGHRAQAAFAAPAPLVATLEPGARPHVPGPPEDPAVAELTLAFPEVPDPAVVEILPADPATIDLEEAPRIVAAGIGLAEEEHFLTLGRVAAMLGASIGATRPVVDAGWTDFARQIGTTGALIDPALYIAVAISGAVQHTSGLGAPEHIVSINTDASCPMMQLADLAVVADGPATLAALERLLAEEAADAD